MPIERLAIIGTGGHAKVVVDALLALGWKTSAIDFMTEDARAVGGEFFGQVIRRLPPETRIDRPVHVAIGSNAARSRIATALRANGTVLFTIIHPRAIVSASGRVGDGSFVAAGAIIGPGAVVGQGCVANHGSVIDHDCLVEDFVHVAPNSTLGGGVIAHANVLIGAGANILPRLTIGPNAIVGAGAVVHRNIPADTTYAGVPARRLREKRP